MTSESDLKAACLKVLKRLGVNAMGNALGGRTHRTGLGPGSPDIVAVLPPIGVFLAIELKKATKQRVAQAKWQAMFERDGGLYFICHSVQEVATAVFAAREKIQSVTRMVARASEPNMFIEPTEDF
jgi:hypothetical protein